MADTHYDYATKSWPIALGCSPAMKCARRCWAVQQVNRKAHSPFPEVRAAHQGLVNIRTGRVAHPGLCWTGVTRLNLAHLRDPNNWKMSQIVATGYHGDLFRLLQKDIDRAFGMMAWCHRHQFLVLTKCANEMREYSDSMAALSRQQRGVRMARSAGWRVPDDTPGGMDWPPPNVWFGLSLMDQSDADREMPHLRALALAGYNTWLSVEPMVGPISFPHARRILLPVDGLRWLKWLVLGGESGKDARPLHPEWVRTVRDQCGEARVPFYFKQWGEWTPREPGYPDYQPMMRLTRLGRNGQDLANAGDGGDVWMQRTGKRAAGCTLDGREWREKPEALR